MASQLRPLASQDCHCRVTEVGPFQSPATAVSVSPSVGVPLSMAGGASACGGLAPLMTGGLTAESSGAEVPAALVAETETCRVLVRSSRLGTYVASVAPEMLTQLCPAGSHRFHW